MFVVTTDVARCGPGWPTAQRHIRGAAVIIPVSMVPVISTPPLSSEQSEKPSRRLHRTAFASGVLMWTLATAWTLFFITWLVLHGWIVPRIGQWRGPLESVASQALGVPVRISSISARSTGLIPSFELQGVTLLDAQGRVAVNLPRLLGTLSPRSLWGLGFEQLVVDQPELDVRRTTDGKIYVGGLDVSTGLNSSFSHSRAADWLFAQPEVVLRGGQVRWTDELRRAPPLALTGVDFVMRNTAFGHAMRLDASPPIDWGARLTASGVFRQPLFSRAAGDFATWSGQVFANFGEADLSRLRQFLKLDALGTLALDLQRGHGALRGWADVSRGRVTGGTVDVALQNVDIRLGPQLEPLAFTQVAGRVGGVQRPDGFEFSTQALSFTMVDGLQWPGGNLALSHTDGQGNKPAQTELKADRLDLAALAQIATRLPLAAAVRADIAAFAPRGRVEALQARWQGPLGAPVSYSAKGQVAGLSVASLAAASVAAVPASGAGPAAAAPRAVIGRPGVSGATVDFDVTQAGGRATVALADGALELPGVFENPRVPMDQLSTEVLWTRDGVKTQVQLRNLQFANADAQGRAQISWRWADPQGPVPQSSIVDVQGSLSRANGAQVHRYLPLVLPEQARHYVRDAVVRGQLSDVKFKVAGPVQKIPFVDASLGDFRISATVQNGQLAYVPPALQSAGSAPWPALASLNGELLFNHAAIDIKGVTGRLLDMPNVQLIKGDARIPDLTKNTTVEVNLALKGPLAEALRFVNTSPVGGLIGQSLAGATGSGNADYRLKLNLPVFAITTSQVDGTVVLPGNEVRFAANTPTLSQLKGTVAFSERGFSVADARARMLGGDVRIDGGMRPGPRPLTGAPDADASVAFKAQGTLTADGVKQAGELGLNGTLAHLVRSAAGSASYTATLGFRRGAMEFSAASSLQGLALDLPAPLGKTADVVLPLRIEKTLLPDSLAAGQKLQDQLLLSLGAAAPAVASMARAGVGNVAGSVAAIAYVRDISEPVPRVLRGALVVGPAAAEGARLPDAGVAANINLPVVDLDAWEAVLDDTPLAPTVSAIPAAGSAPNAASTANTTVPTSPPVAFRSRTNAAAQAYLPTTLAIRATELVVQGHRLNRVVVGGTREGTVWRANVDAAELNGYVEFRQPGRASASSPAGGLSGRLYARLQRLNLAAGAASDVEAVLNEQPSSIPALDIVVEDVELRGRKLGRIEIDAVNRSASASGSGVREWRLNKLNVILPEARLSATGTWAALNAQADTSPTTGAARLVADRRRSVMKFTLDIADSGELLRRFGMPDVVRKGKGKLEGQIAWIGSPLSLDYPTLAGQLNVNIESGQFIKADPGLAKLLGVLSLQSLPRRLTLDFRDVFSEGFAFDFVRGDVNIDQGLAKTNNLQMNGVNAAVLMEGSADVAHETQNLRVVVVPEINAGTASLIATAINPVIGLGTFLAQAFLRKPLMQAATQEFQVDGTWADPRVTKVDRSAKSGDKTPSVN